jgi:hypothetical protein
MLYIFYLTDDNKKETIEFQWQNCIVPRFCQTSDIKLLFQFVLELSPIEINPKNENTMEHMYHS